MTREGVGGKLMDLIYEANASGVSLSDIMFDIAVVILAIKTRHRRGAEDQPTEPG
jgi:hypothetical protein